MGTSRNSKHSKKLPTRRPIKWPATFGKQVGAMLRDAFARADEAEAFLGNLTLDDVAQLRRRTAGTIDESPFAAEIRDYLIDSDVLRLGQEFDDLDDAQKNALLLQIVRMARWGAAHLRTARARRGRTKVPANAVLDAFDRVRSKCKDDAEAYRLVARLPLQDIDGNFVRVSPSTVRNRLKERGRLM